MCEVCVPVKARPPFKHGNLRVVAALWAVFLAAQERSTFRGRICSPFRASFAAPHAQHTRLPWSTNVAMLQVRWLGLARAGAFVRDVHALCNAMLVRFIAA